MTVNNNQNADHHKQSGDKIRLPGINDEVVEAAGIRRCEYPECEQLTGSFSGGVLFPYRDINGLPVMDEGGPYCRLRLDEERGGQKYHQRAGTRTHGYIPPGFVRAAENSSHIFLIEGEKKALALASQGYAVLGLSGFYGAFDGNNGFTNEFADCLSAASFQWIWFIGDSDVIFNPQFSDAVNKLSEVLPKSNWPDLKLQVWSVPPDAPGKGIDDVRAVLGVGFTDWLNTQCPRVSVVDPGKSRARIALQLLEVHSESLSAMGGNPEHKDWVFNGLAKLAAGLADPLAEQEIRVLAESLGFTKRPFGAAITKAKNALREGVAPSLDAIGTRIDLDQPAGVWSRRILESLRDEEYLTPEGCMARLVNKDLVPFNEKQIIPYLDHPDRFVFVRGGDGQIERSAKFEKKHAEVVLGAVVDCADLLRRVRVFSKTPVLLDDGKGGCDLITSYSPDHELLVSSAEYWSGDISLEQTWSHLDGLTLDFCFGSPGDKAMLLALILTPAMAKGGFLGRRRVPFFVITKDQKGAGGGTACQLVSAIHAHKPRAITVRDPQQVYQSVSKALFGGDSIIYLDNVRGAGLSDLSFFESLLTEPVFDGRMIYRHGELDVTHVTTMATSNGLTLSEDLADRAVEIRIKKQPPTHAFYQWLEGDLLSNVERHQSFYLACVHTIIRAWVEAGRPLADAVSGIRFKEWERAIGGILAMRPNDPLVMFSEGERGRRRMMDKMSSPDFERIELLCRDIVQRGLAGQWLTAAQIVEQTDERVTVDPDEQARVNRKVGIMLAGFCSEIGKLKDVGELFKIERQRRNIPELGYRETNEYIIVESSNLSDEISTLTPGAAS